MSVRYSEARLESQGPSTINEDVYRRLKAMIARRELEPGSKLVLRRLAKQLGTSTMPVVEAIRRLERDGLVTQVPKWGASVRKWSEQERLEAFHIRRALEGEAARLFVLRASRAAKDELIELVRRFDELAEVDPIACDEADIAIHLHIVRSTGFTRLAQMVETSKVELATVFGNFWEEKLPDYRSKVGIHRALLSALLGGNPAAAAHAMWDHIDHFGRLLAGDHFRVDQPQRDSGEAI